MRQVCGHNQLPLLSCPLIEKHETDHDQGFDEKTKLDHNCKEAVSDDKENVNANVMVN